MQRHRGILAQPLCKKNSVLGAQNAGNPAHWCGCPRCRESCTLVLLKSQCTPEYVFSRMDANQGTCLPVQLTPAESRALKRAPRCQQCSAAPTEHNAARRGRVAQSLTGVDSQWWLCSQQRFYCPAMVTVAALWTGRRCSGAVAAGGYFVASVGS